MDITSFDDLLQAARAQKEPQRLLFVFANVALPDELVSFEALVQEAAQFVLPDQDWGLVFAAALSGTLDRVPTSSDADAPLQRMVEAIKGGAYGAYIPFDRQGQPVNFS